MGICKEQDGRKPQQTLKDEDLQETGWQKTSANFYRWGSVKNRMAENISKLLKMGIYKEQDGRKQQQTFINGDLQGTG